MLNKRNYLSIFCLVFVLISCKNESKINGLNKNTELELKTDSAEAFNELAYPAKDKTVTISEYNSDNPEIENIERPSKSNIRNLEIDTTKLFGIWTNDPTAGQANFWITKKSFYVADYDGDGDMPYILDKNEIIIYYNDFIERGTITSVTEDTLKIKWSEMEYETEFVKFKN